MEITLKSMTVYAWIVVSMSVQKLREIGNCFCKIFNMKGHILYEASGPGTPHSTDRREDSRTDLPISAIFIRIGSKRHITVSVKTFQNICHSLDLIC